MNSWERRLTFNDSRTLDLIGGECRKTINAGYFVFVINMIFLLSAVYFVFIINSLVLSPTVACTVTITYCHHKVGIITLKMYWFGTMFVAAVPILGVEGQLTPCYRGVDEQLTGIRSLPVNWLSIRMGG